MYGVGVHRRHFYFPSSGIPAIIELAFAPIPDTAWPDLTSFVGDDDINQEKVKLAAFTKRLEQLRFEFDLNQLSFMFQLIPLLEQQWMMALGQPERDTVYGFDDLFRSLVLRANPVFHQTRAPRLFGRLVDLLKLIHTGMPAPEVDDATQEKEFKLKGVENPAIVSTLKATAKLERDKRNQWALSPSELKRLWWRLYQSVWVMKRLIEGFAPVREHVVRINNIDIRYLPLGFCVAHAGGFFLD